MAYGKKYIFSAISKSGLTYTAELWENDYTGPSYQVNTGTNPFILNCLASGDDPFQPILPTTLTIQADFTNFTGPYPDFVSTDDRKYWVYFYANNNAFQVWQGFVLMDSLSIPFTTGLNFVNIICIDGLGLLKSVPYVYTSFTIKELESLLQIIRNCLNRISFPNTYYINSAINYYASGQNTSNSYLRQTYKYPTSWTNDDYTFISCYDVLEKLCLSHGVQLYQYGGEWWITSVNERASDTIRIFRTDDTSNSDTLSTFNINRTIRPYLSDSITPYYFINNNQAKTIMKNFNSLEVVNELEYPKNIIYNGNLIEMTGSLPSGWSVTYVGTGSGSYTMTTETGIYGIRFTAAGTLSYLQGSGRPINKGDVITLEFKCKGNIAADLPVYIQIDTGGTGYIYTSVGGNKWNSGINPYYEKLTSTDLESHTIVTLPAPANGELGIRFDAVAGSPGLSDVFIANVKVSASSTYAKKQVFYNQTANNQYKKSVTIPIGGPFPNDNTSQIQSLLNSSGVALQNFTRFIGGSTYTTLSKLIFSQLYNIFAKPNINLQFTQYNVFTGSNVLGLLQNFGVYDPTSIININDSRFILGQCTIDYVNNTISGTALQVRNTELTYTLLSSIPAAPPTSCYLWVNVSSTTNWIGNYVACDGTNYYSATVAPYQSICAQGTPTKISGVDLLKGSQC